MIFKPFELSKYGEFCYSLEIFSDKSGILSLDFNDVIFNESINVLRNNNNSFVCNSNISGNADMFLSKRGYCPINSYYNPNDDQKPILYNYSNAPEKNKSSYNIRIINDNSNKEIRFTFDKDKTVVLFPGKSILFVYLNDEGKDTCSFNNMVEAYQFTSRGYYCENKAEKIINVAVDSTFIDFKLFWKTKNKSNIPILTDCPSRIIYGGDQRREFRLTYSDDGIITSCISDDVCYSRTENLDIGQSIEYRTIHPLLFDHFNYEYINNNLSFWCEELYTRDKDLELHRFVRNVYLIDQSRINEILEKITSNLSLPIIKILE